MEYLDNTFIRASDLSFQGILNDIKKSKVALQPVFEAFTNAIEAIKIKSNGATNYQGKIVIDIHTTENTTNSTDFNSIIISDNGIGFNDEEFRRFNTFKDQTKGFKNLGSGRLQFVHHFDDTIYISIFTQEGKYYERNFGLSKRPEYLNNNSIVFHKFCKETQQAETGTKVIFRTLLEKSEIYNKLDAKDLKEKLLKRYIHYFCYHKDELPIIEINFFTQNKLINSVEITETDIPSINKTEQIKLNYYKASNDSKEIIQTENAEDFQIDAFRVSQDLLEENDLKLVSKGEVIEESDIKLESLSKNEQINGYKYLFLVSSAYVDSRDTNVRGELNIPSRDSFSRNLSLFTPEEIFIEDIQEEVNKKINSMYPEIEEVKKKHEEQFDRLKEMFLLDDETASSLGITVNDSETKILERFYEAEAKKMAEKDANIKNSIDRLEHLDTTSEDYTEKLKTEIEQLVKNIPAQNRIALTHYVARRQLVLELFDKILQQQLIIQTSGGRNIDEKLLHNLIFQQSTTTSDESDLWLVNEDFIYFKGTSEEKLNDVTIEGVKLIREQLTAEEEDFRLSLGEDRLAKRPDILLFPDEGKCIIIEFKNPNVNVSDHLSQINNYATLIWNFSSHKFSTFYGYLIGEKINSMDVRSYDGEFKEAYNFDYLYRPHKNIVGFFSKKNDDASLYTEVIKYSTLLQRAKSRNKIFIKKLTQ